MLGCGDRQYSVDDATAQTLEELLPLKRREDGRACHIPHEFRLKSAVFTPCPPGPDDRENRQDSSDSGIVSPESTRRPGRWAAGMDPSSSSARDATADQSVWMSLTNLAFLGRHMATTRRCWIATSPSARSSSSLWRRAMAVSRCHRLHDLPAAWQQDLRLNLTPNSAVQPSAMVIALSIGMAAQLFLYESRRKAPISRFAAWFPPRVAFVVSTRDEVDAVHAWVQDRGDEVLRAPQCSRNSGTLLRDLLS